MGLRSTPVSKSLDRKLKMWGLDIPDVFLVAITLSGLNFLLAGTAYKVHISWGVSALLTVSLWIFKRGRPDNHLAHSVKAYFQPKHISAFPVAKKIPRKTRDASLQ